MTRRVKTVAALRAALDDDSVAALEAWGVDARNEDLTGLDLRPVRWRHCRMDGACFDGADLRGSRFCGSNLRGASFDGCPLDGADFGPDDRGTATRLENTTWRDVALGDVRMVAGELAGSRGERVEVTRSGRHGAVLRGAQWEDVAVIGSSLVRANFR
ncbi:MAG: pentapeptide repeat-containing protein, partial [Myxococcota bacterium]